MAAITYQDLIRREIELYLEDEGLVNILTVQEAMETQGVVEQCCRRIAAKGQVN